MSEFWAAALKDDDFEKFPKFIKLLNLLKSHISPEGTSRNLQKQETSALLKPAKSNYLKIVTVYDFINYQMKYKDKLNNEHDKLHRKIQEIIVQNEVQLKLACLQVNEIGAARSEQGLLGLDLTSTTQLKLKQLSDDEVKCLQSMLHVHLEEFFREITQLYNKMTNTGKGDTLCLPKGKLSTEQYQFFLSIIETKKQELNANKEKLEIAEQKQQHLILKYYKVLNNAVQSMTEIGEICSSNTYSSRKAEIIVLKSEILLLNMRSFHLQLMTEVYDENSIKVHLKIKECLDKAVAKLQSEKILTEHRIAAYESVGSEFHALLTEYVEVRTMYEQRSWMLSKLEDGMQSSKE